ncbi:MAG: hypothetical protein ACO3SE_08045 [Sedimenticolaceae bacterium]
MSLGKRIAEKRQANRKQIEVVEWGEDDDPLLIYVGVLSAADVSKLQRKYPGFLGNPTVDAMIDLIIMKAESKDGEKLFTLEDKPFLMRESVTLVSRVAGEMFATVESVESLGND